MTDPILTLRQLNRATLARQMLLERAGLPIPAAIERLVGLQAQAPAAPYFGLWTRLKDFRREDLAALIAKREVVKATWLRATLHLVTAEDYLRLRATLQPMLSGIWSGIAKRREVGFDLGALLAAAKEYIREQPRTFAEISDWAVAQHPDQDVGAMRYGIRTHLPLVQAPVDGGWSYSGNPAFTLAEDWIGARASSEENLAELVRRYLAAFGPASAADMQAWSGFAKLKEVFEELQTGLRVYRDENRRELFDLPGLELPDEDIPAPARFLPEFDNLLLSHSQRRRVIADEHRKKIYLPGLRVAATILVDGFVGGIWKIEKAKGTAVLAIEPFRVLTPADRAALEEEGERLVRFAEPEGKSYAVRFVE